MDVNENRGIMTFKFDYLPIGLLNRVQVRLHQYTDECKIWRDGSFLKKNLNRALIKQQRYFFPARVFISVPSNIFMPKFY